MAGGGPAAVTRYSVFAVIVALLIATLLPAEIRDGVVEGACWTLVVAAIALDLADTENRLRQIRDGRL